MIGESTGYREGKEGTRGANLGYEIMLEGGTRGANRGYEIMLEGGTRGANRGYECWKEGQGEQT